MSSGDDCCSEPRPTWREKLLSHSPFGSHGVDAYAKPQMTRAFVSGDSINVSTDSCQVAQATSLPTSAFTSLHKEEEYGEPSTLIAQSASSSPLLYESDLASDSGFASASATDEMTTDQDKTQNDDKTAPPPSRKKQLSSIFSALMPVPSNNLDRGAGRAAPPRPKRIDGNGSTSGGESEPARSPTTFGQSISQGVKSLQHRHRSSREAAEIFKTMKIEQGESAVAEGRASSESTENAISRRASASPDKTKGGRVESAFNATDNIPDEMLQGEIMLKVTPKKVKQRLFRLDADKGQIYWESKRDNKINLESIREVRTGEAAASYRASMFISASHESRWITIIYQTEGVYKAVHLIALSDEAFQRWTGTLSAVQNERKMLMSGVDLLDQRQQLWLRQHWKAADSSQDSRLNFVEVTKLCRRLGILSNGKDLMSRFQQADTKDKGYLDYADFQHFVTLLMRRVDIEALFLQWADIGVREDSLSKWDFSSEEGQELVRENLHHAVEQAAMSRNQLGCFLATEQGCPLATKSEAVDLILSRYGRGEALDLAGFASFLSSGDNAVLTDQSQLFSKDVTTTMEERGKAQTADELIAVSNVEKTTQDMTRPLSEYYISSSHNTYLVGGQWKGDSTVEGYVRALLQGARSVEIDCWNGPGNEPQVTHGMTLTSKVPFRDVVIAIERYAFVASPFPLILSLEVHNDVAQQEVLATILRDVLGDKLLTSPLEQTSDARQSLPSPQELRGKVLVKAKNLLVPESVPLPSDQDIDAMPLIVAEKRSSTWTTTDTTESESDNLLQSARGLVRSVTKRRTERHNDPDAKAHSTKVLISPLLASLLIYTVGVKHRGINKKEHYAVEHMISLSERSGLKYLKSDVNSEDLIKHNKTHLTRVYPSMSSFKRLNQSANFLPSLFWCMGCQLVAINWQTLDVGFEMNQAMFSRNAKCGYVLKPEVLRLKDLSNKMVPRKRVVLQVSIRVISAQQLPRFRDAGRDREVDNDEVIDPFVSLCIVLPQHRDYSVKSMKSSPGRKKRQSGIQSLLTDARSSSASTSPLTPTNSSSHDAPANGDRKWLCRQKTSVVRANGFNPIWNDTLSFAITLSNIPTSSSHTSDETPSIQAYIRGLLDLCFLRFEVGEKVKVSVSRKSSDSSAALDGEAPSHHEDDENEQSGQASDEESESASLDSLGEGVHCLATHMISLGSLAEGYRHVPLYDAQLSQYLFSTLFVRTDMRIIETS